jgi:hypothetical protein
MEMVKIKSQKVKSGEILSLSSRVLVEPLSLNTAGIRLSPAGGSREKVGRLLERLFPLLCVYV